MPSPDPGALRYVPAAMMTALIVPMILPGPPTVVPVLPTPKMLAALAAFAVAWYTHSTLKTLIAGQTEKISVSTAGVAGNGSSSSPAISGDGRFVVFYSLAGNLVPASWSMEFAVPLCFIALIAPHFRNAPQIGAGVLAGVAVVALDALPMRLNLIAAGVVGIVAGTSLEFAKERWTRR